jgi:hypothetical protein
MRIEFDMLQNRINTVLFYQVQGKEVAVPGCLRRPLVGDAGRNDGLRQVALRQTHGIVNYYSPASCGVRPFLV